MAYQVTAVPSDRLIIVDGEALVFDYIAPHAHLHALQWANGKGELEFTNAPNVPCGYDEVQPYVTLWEEEKARIEAEGEGEGGDDVTPPEPPTLDEAKLAKTQEIDFIATSKITAGFWYEDASLMVTPLHFSFGTEDQSNFNSAMNGANLHLISQMTGQSAAVPSTIGWNGYTDLEHTHIVPLVFNAEQFIQFWGYAETVHKNGILTQARALKEQVTQAATVEEVQAIVWG